MRILEELLGNSFMYSTDGLIHISGTLEKGYLKCTISNGGEIDPPELVERIFELPYTGELSAESQLGLFLARNMLTRHLNGRISLTSENGKTEVSFGFPVKKEA